MAQEILEDSRILGVSSGESGVISKDKSVNLSHEDYVKFFNAVFSSADEHREPRRKIWDTSWALYNNQYDFSQKAWWQHRIPIPKVRTSVDRAVALFRKTLLRTQPFYGLQAESRLGRQKGNFTMLLLDYWFDQSQVIEELVKAFKVGLITSTACLKIWWQTVSDFKPEITILDIEEPVEEFGVTVATHSSQQRRVELKPFKKGVFGLAAVDPYNLWVVPGTNRRGIIERHITTLSEINSLVDDGIYLSSAFEKIKEKVVSETEKAKEASRSGEGTTKTASEYIREMELFHYWGDIYNDHGELIKRDSSFTMAGKDVLLREDRPNPFFHKMPPYIIGTPYLVPFSTYNRGMIEDVGEIAKGITDLVNLMADGADYDALKAFSIDTDTLDDPSEARQGVYPGKVFLKKGNNSPPGSQTVEVVQTGRVPVESNNMLSIYEKYYQEGSFINEFVQGIPGRGEKTLGEVQIKTSSALEGLDESARNLEVTVIEPMLEMSARVIYQYHDDYTLPRLMENYPEIGILLQNMSPSERYSIMVGGFSFRSRGLSIMIDRAQRMGEVKEFLTLLSFLPGLLEMLDAGALIEEILQPLGWNPLKLLRNPSGAGATTTPGPGAQPPVSGPQPPLLGQGPTPMQRRNATEGARLGGATSNPNARPAGLSLIRR